MLSVEAASLFENGSFDFVYLDADHSFESVWQDLSVWYPKIRIGGILAGHDFLDGELPEGISALKVRCPCFSRFISLNLKAASDSIGLNARGLSESPRGISFKDLLAILRAGISRIKAQTSPHS